MKQDTLFFMGMGGPDGIEAIEPFLFNIFSDRDIINFHIGAFLQRKIAKKIAKKRAAKLAPTYMKLGFGGASPQNLYHRKIFGKLAKVYEAKTGRRLDVTEANCYYHPFIEDAVKNLKEKKNGKRIFMTVYPQYSKTTVEACFNRLKKVYDISGFEYPANTIISYWYENEKYCACIANRVKKAAVSLGKDISECHILYSAHSVPISYVEKGDPYPCHIKRHTELINNQAGILSHEISYQSKVGPVKWLTPSTAETLERYAAEKRNNIIVVPISFISDHIETLIELDEELLPKVKRAGLNIIRAESLNDGDDFIDALADIVIGEWNE